MADPGPSLDVLLGRARAAADELASATDALNGSLELAEVALADLKLGVSASVTIEREDTRPEYRDLVFARDASGWRLFIYYQNEFTPEPDDIKHVASASRDLRARAARALPGLLGELLAAVERESAEVRASAKEAANFAVSLRPSTTKARR